MKSMGSSGSWFEMLVFKWGEEGWSSMGRGALEKGLRLEVIFFRVGLGSD